MMTHTLILSACDQRPTVIGMALCNPILVDSDIPLEGRFHFHSLPGPGKMPGGVGTPPISPRARQGAKRENNIFFFFFPQGAITPLEAGLERRGVDTPPTQARPTARVAIASRVNTYLGNILAFCMDSVKIIFHLDPVDMMHKWGGDPAYFLPCWARQKILLEISPVRASPRQRARSEGGLKPRLCTPTHSPLDTRPGYQYA